MLWRSINVKAKQMSNNFGEGVNTYLDDLYINSGELVDCLNMSSDNYPAIEVRKDRTKLALPKLTNPKLMGIRGNSQLHVVDGNTWKYGSPSSSSWTTLASFFNSYTGTIATFKTQTKEYSILGNLDNESDILYAWDGGNYFTNLTSNAPKSNLYTSHKYRLYGINNDKRTLEYSAQGDITDWTTSLDAGTIDVTNARGDITAIRTYQDHVIVWANNSMHELYGTSPYDFTLVDVSNEIGCINQKSHIECNGQLYWLDYTGIYLYTGGIPVKVSNQVIKYIENINWNYKSKICCGALGDKIYFNIPYGFSQTSNNRLLVFDTVKLKWFIEDGNFIQFVSLNEKLYGLDSDGYIWDMVTNNSTGYDSGTIITWSFTTKPIKGSENIGTISSIREIWLDHDGSDDSTLYLGYNTNIGGNTFLNIASTSSFTTSQYTKIDRKILPLDLLNNLNYIQFKINGTGYQKINSILLDFVYHGNTD